MLRRRAPRLLLRLPGELLLRFADRTFRALLLKLPPRMTRLEPVGLSPLEESLAQVPCCGLLGMAQQALHGVHQPAFVNMSLTIRLFAGSHGVLEAGPPRPLEAGPYAEKPGIPKRKSPARPELTARLSLSGPVSGGRARRRGTSAN